MALKSGNKHLSQISTCWDEVRGACGGPGSADKAALEAVMNRYHRAVYRYLLGALRDPDAAEELFQQFALRFLQGGLRGADPRRGRFRDYLKGALIHLIADHKGRRPGPEPLPPDYRGLAVECPVGADADRLFLESWRDELLALTWAALAEDEGQTGRPLHTVLRLRSDHPELRASQLAERLGARLGRCVSEGATRMMLCRARQRFADLLLEEVERSLERPQPGQLEQELSDLGLLDYCRPALERRLGRMKDEG
jgi:RNA polymerase sigma-70 factor (ECF subfamily)